MMENNGGMFMPVAPAGNYGNDGMFGGGWMWFLLVWMAMFGWGNNGWGGNDGDIQRGFDQAAVTNGITNIQTSLCNGFAGVNNAISNGFAQAEIGANARQMADMNQSFALQTGLGDLKYAVATEACADRNAISMALQQVLNQSNANTQRLLDTMCQDKIDAKNETIAMLRQQLQMAELAASQNAQTSTILNACGCNSCGCGN